MGVFQSHPTYSYNYKQMATELNVKDDPTRIMITEIMYDLVGEERLVEIYAGKFKLSEKNALVQGKLSMNTDGTANVLTDDGREIFISSIKLNHALHGDRVEIATFRHKQRGLLEGEVISVVQRSMQQLVGIIQIEGSTAFVIPDSKFIPHDIFIPKDMRNGAKNGQKVIVEITDWFEREKNPQGRIVEVIGDPGVHEVEMHAILAEYNLPYRFPAELNSIAKKLSDTISPKDYAERRDFRGVPTFTIDPADAQDFDDALSVNTLANGNTEVGVHIADVTHYVTPGSAIDEEATQRATSVYLVDRCVPMLPERLSNYICSLRPNEEKLCFSAVFEIDAKGEVINQWFGRTVIKSTRRFAYEEAQQVIETGKGDMLDEILTLNKLAQAMRKQRFASGAIAFDRVEVKFNLDPSGKPLGVFFKEAKEANQLIEEFMLLANRRVAEFIGKEKSKNRELPFVYRIHDKPNPDKLEAFRTFITRFGYNLTGSTTKQVSKSMNKVIADVKGKREQNLIETLALRSMAKARYSTNNIGHYGLAFSHYTHFTSPIRRYPDMMVHRLLAHYLKSNNVENRENLEELCKHASEMEILATEAERASIKYKQVEFLNDKHGQRFMGTISGVTNFGLFVELQENQCEGLVAMRDLMDDYYQFDEDSYALVGQRNGRMFQLGDSVMVEVYRTNLARKQIDFRIVGMMDEAGSRGDDSRGGNGARYKSGYGQKAKKAHHEKAHHESDKKRKAGGKSKPKEKRRRNKSKR